MIKAIKKILKNDYFLPISTLFIYTILLSFPLIKNDLLFQGNDAPTYFSALVYIRESILEYHIFPQWNPFMGLGYPIVGNPIASFYNPVVLLIFLIFPFIFAAKFVYFLCIFVSGISFFILTRYLKLGKLLGLLTSMTYMSSGFMIARIVAGHFDWILIYSLIPIFYLLLFLLLEKKTVLWAGVLAITISLFIFTLTYVALYCLLVFSSIYLYLIFKYFFKKEQTNNIKKQIAILSVSTLLLPLFSAIKLFPMTEVLQKTIRSVDAFSGSQNFISIIYNFFIPSEKIFNLLGLGEYIKLTYFWWESFAFVGPLFLIGLVIYFIFRKKAESENINLILYLLIIFLLYSFLGNPISPFYWIFTAFPALQNFRVPSRIFLFMIAPLLICSLAGINYFYNKFENFFFKFTIVLLFIINLSLVVIVFNDCFYVKSFPYINSANDYLLDYLKKNDGSNYYIAQSSFFQNQVPIYTAVKNHQKIFNPNLGWNIKNNPQDLFTKTDFANDFNYKDIYPKYFIYPQSYTPSKIFRTKIIKEKNGIKIYKNLLYTPYAFLASKPDEIKLSQTDDANIKSVSISIDRINIISYSPDNNHYIVLLENYFPGWKINVDTQEKKLVPNRFLTVKAEKGLHEYSFSYFSYLSLIGSFISFISIVIWGFLCKIKLFNR